MSEPKTVREFTTTAVLNDGTNTDRTIKLRGKVLESEDIVLEPDEDDVSFELRLGHGALSEIRRTK